MWGGWDDNGTSYKGRQTLETKNLEKIRLSLNGRYFTKSVITCLNKTISQASKLKSISLYIKERYPVSEFRNLMSIL